jgi:hypothetical protein
VNHGTPDFTHTRVVVHSFWDALGAEWPYVVVIGIVVVALLVFSARLTRRRP